MLRLVMLNEVSSRYVISFVHGHVSVNFGVFNIRSA
jgi:hypothetical protein